MDIFGGYDSNEKTSDEEKEGLAGLLADYSDDDDVSAIRMKQEKKKSIRIDNANISTDEIMIPITLPPPKIKDTTIMEAKIDHQNKTNLSLLLEFEKDYIKLLPPVGTYTSDEKPKRIFENISPSSSSKTMEDKHLKKFKEDKESMLEISSKSSFAAQLRSQIEFSNPHTFSSITSHFNIDTHGSNIPEDVWNPHDLREFENIQYLITSESEERAKTRHTESKTYE